MTGLQLSLFKGKRQKGEAPPLALERATHIAVADLLRLDAAPGWQWTHFPAGEFRSDATAALLKRMGVQPGWADFLLISPEGQLHCLELKRGKAPLSEAQRGVRAACGAAAVPYEVARSYDEAKQVLALWGALRGRVK